MASLLKQKQIDALPEKVRRAVSRMNGENRNYFEREYQARREPVGNIFILAVFGLHYFFTGRGGAGAAFWLLVLLSLLFLWPLLIVTAIWWLAEILNSGERARRVNGEMAWSVVQDIKELGEVETQLGSGAQAADQSDREHLTARR